MARSHLSTKCCGLHQSLRDRDTAHCSSHGRASSLLCLLPPLSVQPAALSLYNIGCHYHYCILQSMLRPVFDRFNKDNNRLPVNTPNESTSIVLHVRVRSSLGLF